MLRPADLLRHWGIVDPVITRVAEGANDVFRVDPGPYALRVQRRSLMRDVEARSQLMWLDALATDAGVTAPRPVPLPSGAPFLVEGDRRVVLLHWVEGTSLLSLSPIDAAEAVGATIARLHNHAATWHVPEHFIAPEHSCRAPDAAELGISPSDGNTLTAAARVVNGVMDALGRDRDRFGVVHGDLNFDNFVLHEGEARPIDFDEFGLGFYLSDIAEPLRVLIFREDYERMRAALLGAYCKERPLPVEDQAHIDTFIASNLLATLCWAARPESSAHRHEIEPWIDRWIEAIVGYCDLGRG